METETEKDGQDKGEKRKGNGKKGRRGRPRGKSREPVMKEEMS